MPNLGLGHMVLKEDEVFVICDERGDITPAQLGAGLYLRDMRYLSLYTLTLNGAPPALLGSSGMGCARNWSCATSTPSRFPCG